MVLRSLKGSLCLLFLWFATTIAIDIHGRVEWNDVCSNATELGRAKAILDSGSEYAGSITASGDFTMCVNRLLVPANHPNTSALSVFSFDVPSGTYLLSIITHDYTFDKLRIDVHNPADAQTVEVRPYIEGTPLHPPSTVILPYPIKVSAKGKFAYFSPPDSFNLITMLSNPMTMMMVFGGIMMLATPYMMKNLDPEALEEMKKEQAKVAGVQKAIASGNFKGGISAIMAAADEATAATVAKTPQKSGKSKKSKR
ncbi:hypothetical protein D9611_003341 [Ephemerocybe angulata]|uniref:ER membrane protein complex subunit 7 beta-sandwich domain-containing protein n=1 Tax=Ephemerocybe angulata TaxID=980116 RepID=A0A8H5C913_9AGAR|nr:hypothetical protein D9611_003341 [Tulosesus angulatus]